MTRTRTSSSRRPSGFFDEAPTLRRCEAPGCEHGGEFRAPKSRDALTQYYWFCLDHVREYNSGWNYYQGMTPEEIEAHVRKDTTWQRPSWPFSRGGATDGTRPRAREPWRDPPIRDRYGFFNEDGEPTGGRRKAGERRGGLTPEQEEALELFDLAIPLDPVEMKSRYKALVKLHHPDTHGGAKEAEEKLKDINRAYATLRAALSA
ncbi:J domain-containing protein [Lacibacterium aquatile]|uniref:J domain-containing protein n=1 Tax=Lacibacterium aquatile TaxID=1168082 RepID=A0ABW5DLY5_9PROT